ncbi:ABC transporter substrate-binding protein [Rhodococcus sp. UFZ-B548]|uniref:ABC transporter substrate-binding protein n=1 Tax=Rhodococcus sp. UFZ-B548 TaxID=2742212 RepID=UPI0015F3916C|nr:ABC transporter substrate-binding protein [Rhodococcus sp. UFZ-B548]
MKRSLSRRSLLQGVTGIAAAGGLAGVVDLARAASADRSNATERLRVGYLPITDAAPLLVAHSEGLYQPNVVSTSKPVLFRSWASLAEAFVSREVDIVHLLMPMAIQLRYSLGSDVKILGWNHTNGSAFTVAPHIRELGDLAGQQVAIPFWWSIHNIAIQKLFRAHGLIPVVRQRASKSGRTVELIVMSPSDMVPALAAGSIGGYTVADPFNAVAEIRGIGRIHSFIGDVWREHACCALLVHADLIERNPTAVQGITNAVVAAQIKIVGDRGAASAMLSDGKYLPQPLPAITKSLTYQADKYVVAHPEWEPQRIGFQPFPFSSFTAELVEAMHNTVVDGDTRFLDRLDPNTTHDDLVDDRFVRQSIDLYGGPGVVGLSSFSRTEEVDAS